MSELKQARKPSKQKMKKNMAEGKTKDSELNGSKHFPNLICLNFVVNVTSICYSLFQIYEVYYIFEGLLGTFNLDFVIHCGDEA
jgi:hypothetical protein